MSCLSMCQVAQSCTTQHSKRMCQVGMENGWSYLTYLKPVVCPRSPLHSTMLHVEWKLFNVDVTYGHVNSVTEPCDLTGVLHYHVSVNNRRTIIRICTKINLKKWKLSTKIYYYTILKFHFYLIRYLILHPIKSA